MSDLDQTLDRPYAQQPATRAAAVRVLNRQPDGDLLRDILGLNDPPAGPNRYVLIDGKLFCKACRLRCQSDGVCRRGTCAVGGAR